MDMRVSGVDVTSLTESKHLLDPVLLETLMAVADTRSFTEAARKLKRSQSTVSSAIRRIEDLVGCKLVSRTTRSVLLTNEGEEMVRFARTVCGLAQQAKRRLVQPNCAEAVRLGVFSNFTSPLMAQALGEFHRRHAGVQVKVETNRSDLLLSRMRDGELDLVLATRQQGHGFGPALWQDELVWIGTAQVPKTRAEPVPLAVCVRPSMLRRMGIEALNVARRPHTIAFEGTSYTSVAAAVGAGLGVSVFPQSLRPPGIPALDHWKILPPPGRIGYVLLAADSEIRPEVASLHSILRDLSPALFETAGAAMFGCVGSLDLPP